MERYEQALTEGPSSIEDKLAACRSLGDPDLAGDCAHAVVHRAVMRSDGDPAVLCPQVPPGLWRAECWFEAAETTARKDKKRAIELCDLAEPFREDCRQHLWQGQLKRMVDRTGPRHFAQQLERAQALHDLWARLLHDDPEQSFRFWRRFYQAGLGGMVPLDLAVCDDLPDLHRERCIDAGSATWIGHLEQAILDPKKERIVCTSAELGDLVQAWAVMGPPVAALSHPRLELAAQEFQQNSCLLLEPGSNQP